MPHLSNQLLNQIHQIPGEVREDVLQKALQEFGRAKGLSWEDTLDELHTTYLYHLEEEKRDGKRWAWLTVALENESTDGLADVLQILIEAMGKQQGRSWQETCEHIETPIDALTLEAHVRKTVMMSVLTGAAMPQLIALLKQVQEDIEQAQGLEPGTLIREIARASKNEKRSTGEAEFPFVRMGAQDKHE